MEEKKTHPYCPGCGHIYFGATFSQESAPRCHYCIKEDMEEMSPFYYNKTYQSDFYDLEDDDYWG